MDLPGEGRGVHHDRLVRPRVSNGGADRMLRQSSHRALEVAGRVGERRVAACVGRAAFEHRVEGRLAVLWDALEDRDVEQGSPVQHDGPDMRPVLSQVVLGERRSVRGAVEVDPVVSERDPHIVEVVGGLGARVEARVGVESGQRLIQERGERHRHLVPREPGEIGSFGPQQQVRVARASLIDEHDVSVPVDDGEQVRCARPALGRSASGPAGQEEDRIGLGIGRHRGDELDVEVDLSPIRVTSVLRHGQVTAHRRVGSAGEHGHPVEGEAP